MPNFKKIIIRKMNYQNFGVIALCILVSYTLVSLCGNTQELAIKLNSADELSHSALRLADAFDYYNQRRFAQ